MITGDGLEGAIRDAVAAGCDEAEIRTMLDDARAQGKSGLELYDMVRDMAQLAPMMKALQQAQHKMTDAAQGGVTQAAITYTTEKSFSVDQVVALFRAVGWHSADYPTRLHEALMGSSYVVTAWDGDRLVGLVRALDDGELNAYLKYLLVDPAYQGRGIAGALMRDVLDHYRDYLYVDVMPEESKNAPLYEHFGFERMPDGVPLEIWNQDASLMR